MPLLPLVSAAHIPRDEPLRNSLALTDMAERRLVMDRRSGWAPSSQHRRSPRPADARDAG